MSPRTPNTRGVKLYKEHKSRNNHSVIGLSYIIVHPSGKSLIVFFLNPLIWDLPEWHDFAHVVGNKITYPFASTHPI